MVTYVCTIGGSAKFVEKIYGILQCTTHCPSMENLYGAIRYHMVYIINMSIMSQLLELNMTQKHRLMKTTQLLDSVQNCQNNHSFIYRATSEDVRCSIFNSCWGVDFNSSAVHLQGSECIFHKRPPTGFTFKIHSMWYVLNCTDTFIRTEFCQTYRFRSNCFHHLPSTCTPAGFSSSTWQEPPVVPLTSRQGSNRGPRLPWWWVYSILMYIVYSWTRWTYLFMP